MLYNKSREFFTRQLTLRVKNTRPFVISRY